MLCYAILCYAISYFIIVLMRRPTAARRRGSPREMMWQGMAYFHTILYLLMLYYIMVYVDYLSLSLSLSVYMYIYIYIHIMCTNCCIIVSYHITLCHMMASAGASEGASHAGGLGHIIIITAISSTITITMTINC